MQLREKLASTEVGTITSNPTTENPSIVDPDEPPSETSALNSAPASSTVPSKTKVRSADETALADLAGNREQLITMQRDLLERLQKPHEAQERDAFLDWAKLAVAGLEQPLWRRFQRDMQHLVNRYVDMHEHQQLQTNQSAFKPRAGPVSSHDTEPSPVQWQPADALCPPNIVHPTSVLSSQESAWVQQQRIQQTTRPLCTPLVYSSTPTSHYDSPNLNFSLSNILDLANNQGPKQVD